jgi:hypothetical protein
VPSIGGRVWLAAAAAIAIIPDPAAACSFVGNRRHVLDPAHAADATPPGPTTVLDVTVGRYDTDGCVSDTCGAYGVLTLSLAATDDATPGGDLAYQLVAVRGSAPPGLLLDQPIGGDPLYLYFDFDDVLDLDLEIRAVDLNGNLGPPVVIRGGRRRPFSRRAARPAWLPRRRAAWVARRRSSRRRVPGDRTPAGSAPR